LIHYHKFEVIATGGFTGDKGNKLGAFLGVTVLAIIAEDTNFIIFSPIIEVESIACPWMLRNYSKKAILRS
jgi:hypothetical protein